MISVRYGVLEPSELAAHRVFQNISLPLKKARLTPALSAACTFARSFAGPVLVVAAGDEDLVVQQQRARPVEVVVGRRS